jgi:hypothetical protein
MRSRLSVHSKYLVEPFTKHKRFKGGLALNNRIPLLNHISDYPKSYVKSLLFI